VGFERPHAKQVYPIFEFTDDSGGVHRVINSSQQAIVRFASGDSVPVVYSKSNPQLARVDTLGFNHRWAMGCAERAATTAIRVRLMAIQAENASARSRSSISADVRAGFRAIRPLLNRHYAVIAATSVNPAADRSRGKFGEYAQYQGQYEQIVDDP
jgi:hypothetical protein